MADAGGEPIANDGSAPTRFRSQNANFVLTLLCNSGKMGSSSATPTAEPEPKELNVEKGKGKGKPEDQKGKGKSKSKESGKDGGKMVQRLALPGHGPTRGLQKGGMTAAKGSQMAAEAAGKIAEEKGGVKGKEKGKGNVIEKGMEKGKCKAIEKGMEKGKSSEKGMVRKGPNYEKGMEKGKSKDFGKGKEKGKLFETGSTVDEREGVRRALAIETGKGNVEEGKGKGGEKGAHQAGGKLMTIPRLNH